MALLNCARRFRDELFRKRKARAPCLEFLRVTSSYQEGGKNEARNCERIVATVIRGAAHKACTRGGKQAAIAFILGAWISFSNTPSARSFRWRGPSSSPCWLFRRQYTFFPELINANCTPFHFRLLDTPYLAFFYPPFSLTHAHTLSRAMAMARTHAYPFSFSSSIHSCSLCLRLPLSVSHPSSPFPSTPFRLFQRGCWLQTGSWKFAIQDIDQLTRPTPPPPSHIRSLPPGAPLSLSVSLPFPSLSTALLLTIAKQSVFQTLLLIVHLIRSFLLWYSARILYKSR